MNDSNTQEDTTVKDSRHTLTTNRLIMRPFQSSDEEAVFRICSAKEIAANTRTIPHPYPRAQAAHWIKQHPKMWKEGTSAIFAICKKDDAELVGAIGLEINEKDHNAELGYWIDKQHWGSGFCSEAAVEVLRFGFEKLGVHKIHAHHITTNPASGRVMEKIGMKREGVLRGHIRKWGVFYDVAFFGILNSDYAAGQNTE